jgi:hypothetical protein
MANTIPILSFTNTFGDLLTQQNRQAVELNNLAANNYTKDTGTLFLDGTGTGLSVTAAALLGSGVVSGTLSVGGDISAVSNVFINGAGNALEVANNTLLRGSLITNGITANTLIRANTFNAAGNVFANDISSNNIIRATTLNASGNAFVNTLQSNGAISGARANIVGALITNSLISNTSIRSSTLILDGDATIAGATSIAGQLAVGGNFIIVGTTVYNTNSFTINANSSVGLNSTFSVNRGSSGANASIRWNEVDDYFEINDVNNGLFYRVLSDEYLSNSTNLASSSNVATSLAVNYLQNVDNTQNTRIQSIETINTNQNTSISIIESVNTTQNTRLGSIETVDVAQNTAISIIEGVNATQNTRLGSIETVDVAQNTAISIIEGVNATQNTRLGSIETINNNQNTTITQVNSFAASAFTTANGANGLAAGAFDTANNRVSSVSGTSGRITSTGGLTPVLDLATAGPGATSATNSSVTIDAYGRVTALSSGTAPVTSITGTASQITVSGTTTPTLSLPQNIATGSSVQFGSFGVGTAASGTTGEIRATNNITAYYSDDRLKTKLGNIQNALEKIMSLNGFYHEANETAQALGYEPIREVGVSAQEVNAVLPEVVAPAPIDPQYMTVRYERMIPLLIEAIKELKAEVEELKKK